MLATSLRLPVNAQHLYNRINLDIPLPLRKWIAEEAMTLRHAHPPNYEATLDEHIRARFPQFGRRAAPEAERLYQLLQFLIMCKAYWADQLHDPVSWADVGCDDAQLSNVELQNVLQKQQQTLQMLSTMSKNVYDTQMAILRKIGG